MNKKISKVNKNPKKRAGSSAEISMALVSNPGTGSGLKTDNSITYIFNRKGYKNNEKTQSLYRYDGIFQQIVETTVLQTLMDWRTNNDTNMEQIEKRLKYKRNVMISCINARKNGECLIMPVLEFSLGGKVPTTMTLERALQKGASIRSLAVIENFEQEDSIINDSFSPYHGRPRNYIVNEKKVHVSRVIPFFSNLSKSSILDSVGEYLSDFHLSRQDVSKAVQESTFLIYEVDMNWANNQYQKYAQRESEGSLDFAGWLQQRVRNIKCNANTSNAYSIDIEKEKLTTIEKSNIDDLIDATDQKARFLAGAANQTVAELFADNSSGGLTDKSVIDIQNTVNSNRAYRFFAVEPALDELDEFVSKFEAVEVGYIWNETVMEKFLIDQVEVEDNMGANNASN